MPLNESPEQPVTRAGPTLKEVAWHYDPPTPQTEADVTLTNFHNRLRAAEKADRLDEDVDEAGPPRAGRLERLRNAIFTKLGRPKTGGDGAP